MSMIRMSAGVMFLASLLLILPATAQDRKKKGSTEEEWSQWRGPRGDGISKETEWQKKWPRFKIKKNWSMQLGNGYSAVSEADGRLYTMGYGDGKDTVYCIDRKTAKVVWKKSYACKVYDNMNAGGPSATPAVADGRVFTVSREAQAYCFDAKSGKVLWEKDLRETNGARVPTWGFSGSFLVVGDQVFLDVGPILCFDAKTGKEVWKSKNYGAGYSTPVTYDRDGEKYIVAFPAHGLVILKREDGKEVATHRWKTSYQVNAATPIINGDEIFISSGYNTGCAMLKFDGTSLRELWKNGNMRNHMATCIFWEGYLYGFDEGTLRCLNAKTGEVEWSERGLGKATLGMAEGRLIVLSDRGELVFADATPKGFEAVKKQAVFRARNVWTVPVLSNGRIYCRSPKGELVSLTISR